MLSGKVWGRSKLLRCSAAFELHQIDVYTGGYCSKHKHETKWNGFFILSGQLEVSVWQPSGLVDVTTLVAGDYTEVAPGLFHRFHAVEFTVALETYWSEIKRNDIVRETQGGIR
jgi:mannose-6-phosphate isomerase-like protein (cupin superfamily)